MRLSEGHEACLHKTSQEQADPDSMEASLQPRVVAIYDIRMSHLEPGPMRSPKAYLFQLAREVELHKRSESGTDRLFTRHNLVPHAIIATYLYSRYGPCSSHGFF